MIAGWLSNAADYFWAQTDPPATYPRDLTLPALRAFVLDEQVILGLRVSSIQKWFLSRKCAIDFPEQDRRLRGCLTAIGGCAIVFIDGADSDAERRFTFAHEIAHLLLDYRLPRVRAISLLGPSILQVLDCLRPPTESERIHAAIKNCSLGLYCHLLDRRDQTGHVASVESRADLLAWELLAPDEELEHRYEKIDFCRRIVQRIDSRVRPASSRGREIRRSLDSRPLWSATAHPSRLASKCYVRLRRQPKSVN